MLPEDNNEGTGEKDKEQQDGGTPPANTKPPTFDAVYNTLPQDQRTVLDGHISGLRTALKDERDGRKALEKQLRDLSKQAEEGSAIKTQLTAMAEEQATTAAKATFFETAHDAKVKNLRLAWLAAIDYKLVDVRTGEADFDKLRKMTPELFEVKTPPQGNAGAGAKQTGMDSQKTMNDFIRTASGRGR